MSKTTIYYLFLIEKNYKKSLTNYDKGIYETYSRRSGKEKYPV